MKKALGKDLCQLFKDNETEVNITKNSPKIDENVEKELIKIMELLDIDGSNTKLKAIIRIDKLLKKYGRYYEK